MYHTALFVANLHPFGIPHLGYDALDESKHSLPIVQNAETVITSTRDFLEKMTQLATDFDQYERRLKDLPESILKGPMGFYQLKLHVEKIIDLFKNEAFMLKETMEAMDEIEENIVNREQELTDQKWTNEWKEQKEIYDEESPDDSIKQCAICFSNKAIVRIKNCHCKTDGEGILCGDCAFKHYFSTALEKGKSSSECPLCKASFTAPNIILDRNAYIEQQIKTFSTGKKSLETTLCECGKRPIDSYISCCDKAENVKLCAECLLGKTYEKILEDKNVCEFCTKRQHLFVINRPFYNPYKKAKKK